MMSSFLIEVERATGWNLVTTVRVTAARPADREAARRRALREAKQQLSGWSGYFLTSRLRIREAG